MSNRNNNDSIYHENEQNSPSLPRQNRVVEIPVIHCPSLSTTQTTQPTNYTANTLSSNFQSRPFQNSIFSTFDEPFG